MSTGSKGNLLPRNLLRFFFFFSETYLLSLVPVTQELPYFIPEIFVEFGSSPVEPEFALIYCYISNYSLLDFLGYTWLPSDVGFYSGSRRSGGSHQ